ncbi:MAG: O-antigen translocase [Chitinophagaceae bacterium]|nr:O-antigen translocase [Chitinophagaceae bacterium]
MLNMLFRAFKRIKNIPIIKVSSLTAVATVVRVATNLILSKVLAITVGATGIALVGQIINGSNIFMNIASGGLSQGITKYIAETDDFKERKKIINTVYTFVLFASIFVAAVLIIFAPFWSNYFFHTNEYWDVIIYMGVFIVFFAYNSVILAIINGLKQFKLFVIVNIANNIVGLLITVILLYFFNLRGALIATVLYQSVVFFVTIFFIRNQKKIFSFSQLILPSELIKKLLGFSLMMFISIICISVSQIYIRTFIASHISFKDAGIWEALNRISAGYLLFASASIVTYYLPRLSELQNPKDVWNEILHSSKAILPLVAMASLLVFLFRKIIILVLFDKSFMYMEDLFMWQMIGDFLKITAWMFAYTMWAKRWVTIFVISEISLALVYCLLSVVCIDNFKLGLYGAPVAYCVTYVLYLLGIFFMVKQKLGISFKPFR